MFGYYCIYKRILGRICTWVMDTLYHMAFTVKCSNTVDVFLGFC